MQEEERPGTLVGSLMTDANLAGYHGSVVAKLLRFQFLSQPSTNFSMHNTSGELRTSGRIDRDSLCPGARICLVNLDVAVGPVQYFQIIKINVTIRDINDNIPRFPQQSMSHEMLESTLPGSSFIIPAAQDPDSPPYGIHGYKLVPESRTFELHLTHKLDGTTEVRVHLKSRLDREKQSLYHFQVVAFDGGRPPKSNSLELDIRVLDVNDNSPVFDNATYRVSVSENQPALTMLVQVHAEDHDSGPNSQIVYGFSHQTRKTYGHLFSMNKLTGELSVKQMLDHELGSVYQLVVTAQDRGQSSMSTDTTVIVTVLDENDHAPEINVNTLTAIGSEDAEVSEASAMGTFVAQISVSDRDSGDYGKVHCNLRDSRFRLRKADADGYQVVTAKPLDRETTSHYNLAVVCKDAGPDPQMTIKHINVQVTDINDNAPKFTRDKYKIQMHENNPEGHVLQKVNATDPDDGLNGRVIYSILPKEMRQLFDINQNNGLLLARESLDREEFGEIEFMVVAEDRGYPALTSSAQVIVILDDVNDEAPEFSKSSYSFGILENQVTGTHVGQVAAKDKDQFPNNQFSFTFQEPNLYHDCFNIEARSGKISTRRPLDREMQTVYNMVVLATDDKDAKLFGSAYVTVFVTDQNDNKPVFQFPSKLNNTIHISNKVPVGYTITRVKAMDADLGESGNVTYSVIKGGTIPDQDANNPANDVFSLDPKRGSVSVNVRLEHVTSQQYSLRVMARDHGFHQLTASTTLHIVVNDSIPFSLASAHRSLLSGTNFVIVIILASISLVVILLLITAITTVVLRQRRQASKNRKYGNCAAESMKMLQARDTTSSVGDGVGIHKPASRESLSSATSVEQQPLEMTDREMDCSPKKWRPTWIPPAPDPPLTAVTEVSN